MVADDKYFKYKLKKSEEKIEVENYFDNRNIYCEQGYFKKITQVFTIPINHHKIKLTKIIYDRDPSISLIIEKTNNAYSDIYFWTNRDIEDVGIKSTITSFTECLT